MDTLSLFNRGHCCTFSMLMSQSSLVFMEECGPFVKLTGSRVIFFGSRNSDMSPKLLTCVRLLVVREV